MNKLFTSLSILLLLGAFNLGLKGQSNILNPADPDVIYTAANQPAPKAWNDYKMYKWGHTARLSWNPYSFGFKSYLFSSMAFRLKFPKTYQHNVVDGQKYPLFIFFHGKGEAGSIYDNEYQLLHGGQLHAQKVNDGTFDGFLLYIQSTSGASQDYATRVSSLIDSLTKHVKVDIDRIVVSGLSNGGGATWDFLANNNQNKKIAAALPISAAANGMITFFPNYITVPVWVCNGGLDPAPAKGTVTYLVDSFRALGGKIDQTFFPTQGHGVWGSFWNTNGYWPYLGAQHKANPLVYFQRNQFCPLDPVSARLALNPGFSLYEWEKDGVVIPGANSSSITVTTYGTYRGRFKRTATSAWSLWSPTPVVISQKQGTITPPIQTNGLYSSVLPSIDGNTTVPLMVPNNFAAYEWRRLSDNALVSTSNTYNAPIGQYKVKVTEQFGCSSIFSDPFTVISASGTNVPDNITNFSGSALTSSSVRLDWNDNPAPSHNETAFEIFRSTKQGSDYVLVGVVNSNIVTHTDLGLLSNTKYYYVVRAINSNGAATLSNEINVTTKNDIVAPTAPANLRVTSTSRSSISLAWDPSSDDVSVNKYDVYVNGVKSFVTTNTSVVVSGLPSFQTFALYVKARDLVGNESPKSNQVTASSGLQGLNYKYYHGTWSVLPNFATLTPEKTGTSANIDLSVRSRNDNIGFLWEGSINIPVTGSYTFETISDDGSKLYIGSYSHTATALVNNDGAHGMQSRTGTITLTAGSHPIAITFFQGGGGYGMQVYWQSVAAGISRQLIPNSAFTDNVPIPPAAIPAKPSSLIVNGISYNKINIAWTDDSDNESGFEVVRATTPSGIFLPIGTTSENINSYVDSTGLIANTKYWYKVRSISQYGQSEFISVLEGSWSFDSNYNDASGNNRSLTAGSSPTFNTTDKKEGTAAISLNGSNQFADMPFSTLRQFPSNAYTTRSVALWIKPLAASITGTNKIIFDFGGSDNGLSLRFNSSSLQAGIASGNIRATAVVNAITANPNWIAGGWNHVSVVYNLNVLKLFVNGIESASTNLSFSSVASTTNSSRIGATNSSNAFNSSTSGTNVGGLIDNLVIISEPLISSGITALMGQSYGSDTTLPLPLVPADPTISSLVALSTNSVLLTFNDNSSNETSFEVFRSVGSVNNFRLQSTISAGSNPTALYTDNNLFANTNYYYKVKAIGIGGESAFTEEVVVKTLNNAPVISNTPNFTMRYDGQKTLQIVAGDLDGETMAFTILSVLPTFATFTNTGNGLGSFQFHPTSIPDQGIYPVSIKVTDTNGSADTLAFTLTVNDNYIPVITALNNANIAEGSATSISLFATDLDGTASLTWALTTNTTPFVTLTDNGNGAGSLLIAPGYLNAGVYPITVSSNDGAGGIEYATFTLTVTDVQPILEKVYMSMKHTSGNAPAPWNNIFTTNTNSLLNSAGQSTPIGIEFLGTAWNGGNAGAITGNNSGVYPDAVLRDYFYFGVFGAPETVNINLKGLTPAGKYNVTLYGNSAWRGLGNNGTTVYTINGVQKPLYVDNNTQNTVTFSSVIPNAAGIISVNMSKGSATPYGLITSIVLEKPFDDGTSPVLPVNLSASPLLNGTVKLSWTDLSYNEDKYLVYRATNETGPFSLLNFGASNANDSVYIDNSVASSTAYFYRIEAVNAIGSSGFTNVVGVITGNKAPVLSAVNDLVVKTGANGILNFSAADDLGDVLTSTVTGLPAFALFQNNGNGNGSISFSPSVNDIGSFNNIIVMVTDNLGASTADTFKVTIVDNNVRSVLINFGVEGGNSQPAPWNNFMYPYANAPLGGLKDDASLTTSFSVRLQQQWDGIFSLGMTTGYNAGIFPDNVIKSSIQTSSSAARGIQLDGLDPAKRYNVVFFSSHNAGASSVVTFANGAQTVAQESRYNDNGSVQLNGLAANASGTLVVTATKNASAAFLNLNAMIIEEYAVGAPLLRPQYLLAETVLDSGKVKLTWADRSANETGFEIYHSTSENGAYVLIATIGANIKTFTKDNLTSNQRHYFKVRAISATETSGFSNIASAVLPVQLVFVNFNVNPAQNAPTPWNNTNNPPVAGAKFSNLNNNAQGNSGIEMVITEGFSGPGFAGSTGAGILPSGVMESNYWNDAGQLSQLKFSNLDIRKKYRIGLFGSAIFSGGYSIANYTCNGKTVQLNSLSNNAKIVYLKDLGPVDGELIIDIRTASGSSYCFTGAVTIESYDDILVPEGNIAGRSAGNNDAMNISTDVKPSSNTASVAAVNSDLKITTSGINVYPNPFTNRLDIELDHEKESMTSIVLYDLNGRLVHRTADIKQLAGYNKITVNLPSGKALSPGTYVVNILVNGKLAKAVKLIRVN